MAISSPKSNEVIVIDVSIVIVSFNTAELLNRCLDSIYTFQGNLKLEVFVVDNHSSDQSVALVKNNYPSVYLIENKENIGFARANNQALKLAKGKYCLLLNSDAFLDEGSLEKSISYMNAHPNCGVMGAKLLSEDGSMQASARKFITVWQKFLVKFGIASKFSQHEFLGGPDYSWWDHRHSRQVDWVVGAYFFIRGDLVRNGLLLDERFFMYFEEMDYCKEVKARSWTVDFNPEVEILHIGGASASTLKEDYIDSSSQSLRIFLESEYRYYRKHYSVVYVLLIAGVEIVLHLLRFFKNSLSSREESKVKVHNSMIKLKHYFKTLITDRLGSAYEL